MLAFLPNLGTTSASGTAINFRLSYSALKLALLVGICGDVPGTDDDEVLLGDVVISKTVIQYTLGLTRATSAFQATILADSNRDGKVDLADETDDDKTLWTEAYGALFLANIGDTNGRCSSQVTTRTPDGDLSKCNDASDNVLRNSKYIAPLRTLPIQTLSDDAIGSISVLGETAADNVRIFHKSGEDWVYVVENTTFTAQDLRAGLELGIDGRNTRFPGVWDGRVQVQFNVTDGSETGSDSVALRVAPVLTHHHLQHAQQVFTNNYPGMPLSQQRFAKSLKDPVAQAGIEKPVFEFTSDPDIWVQDFFEPGYSSIPGPNGPVVLRINIRSGQSFRSAGRQIFTDLRSDSVGAIQYLGSGDTTDSMGNLETIPPHSFNNKTYTAGRIIMGQHDSKDPWIMAFLRAQEAQDPVITDHDWLAVGHTDEYMQFLPANNSRGWVVMLADPLAGIQLLRDAQAAGHGGVTAVSRVKDASDPEPGFQGCLPNLTIDQVLQLDNLTELNTFAMQNIQKNIDIVKNAVGLTDEDILYVPGIYYDESFPCTANGPGRKQFNSFAAIGKANALKPLSIIEAVNPNESLEKRQTTTRYTGPRLVAMYPGAVNGVVLSDSQVLAPAQWGPIIDGKDILTAAVVEAYSKVNFTVIFIDDWYDHHELDGEVHCGTNVYRDGSAPWW
ncbi:uncharacterized protein TRIVIDRAFT_231266 [Trichoderma virens Gv29-8]|uniref:Protein-arginine deiminase C-terminal domain-containing protein n=1 Tax=Hypocrea virens (strain Gv29-8 / FGSC 10586) TaxID=413071 RepID=G9N074_HYPVG|nr:uncharacterized protein TRIVIDRAFT_231266 [Trichoderma virens Gv29-8]EHK19756.1 hypothetical protein TRIVIDRAFT_231266 [Trichoderma virens Gv29-8]UKZ53149.1 hypothetical protein TrVGV298_006941 [Trichoderma virens]